MMRVRVPIVVLAALAASFACAQAAKRISYTAPGVNAKRVMEELSNLTGQKLAVNTTIAREPLIIDVTDVDPEALLQKIAEAVRGNWIEEPDKTRRLVHTYTPQAWAAVKFNSRVARFDALKKELKDEVAKAGPQAKSQTELFVRKATAVLSKPQTEGEDESQIASKMIGTSPLGLAAKHLIANIPAQTLASVRYERNTVLSSKPSRLQVPFPASCAAPLRELAAQLRHFQELSATFEPETGLNRWDLSGLRTFIVQANDVWTTDKINVVLKSDQDTGATRAEIQFVDAALHVRYSFEVSLNDARIQRSSTNLLYAIAGKSEDEEPTAYTIVDRDFVRLFQSKIGRQSSIATRFALPDKALNDKLTSPSKHDPLSFVLPTPIVEVARRGKLDLVADFQDNATFAQRLIALQNMVKSSQVAKLLANDSGIEWRQADGWLTIRESESDAGLLPPSNPRVDRVELERLFQESKSLGQPSLAATARFAFKFGDSVRGATLSLASHHLMIMQDVQPTMLVPTALRPLRIYGSLQPQQLADAQSALGIRLGDLNADQRMVIESMLFGARAFSTSTFLKPSYGLGEEGMIEGAGIDPTDWYASTLDEMRLRIVVDPEELVTVVGFIDGVERASDYTADQLGELLNSMDHPVPGQDPTRIDRFRMMQADKIVTALRLGGRVITYDGTVHRTPAGKFVTSLSQLPIKFVERVLAAKQRAGSIPPLLRHLTQH